MYIHKRTRRVQLAVFIINTAGKMEDKGGKQMDRQVDRGICLSVKG